MDLTTRHLSFYQADVFTDVVFGGNPVAVFPNAPDLSNSEFQQIANEMNLSETVFVLPSSHSDVRIKLRIFTPTHELPFAGHPVLGTCYVLGKLGHFPIHEPITHIQYECNIGVFSAELYVLKGAIDRVEMGQPSPQFIETVKNGEELFEVARALGLNRSDIAPSPFPVEVVSTGLPVMIIPARTLTAVKSIQPDQAAITDVCQRYGSNGMMVFSTMTVDDYSTVHTRMFAAPIGIDEDPATGSASGALGAYLVKNGVVEVRPTTEIVAEQGYEMDRPSKIFIQVFSDDDVIQAVKVGGQVVMVAEGKLFY
ncbi:MAG: PhzF family phenazine biosynthesis protein [Nitrospirales bacterium]|nr:PhzF family phenazine biosynthesis protein [Nitrospira sp.]MDR4502812.1 PhzF family phenazine biosynthesis protein [Nitrospirales bacterium]